jgi:hypothetical protein
MVMVNDWREKVMGGELGTFKKLEVRSFWINEFTEFTPWLAKEENLARLGEAIGLELELESTEVSAGPYSADILAKDTGTDKYVVIENQLEKTNHDHLGKAITYASALNASAIVWIAPMFTDEHKRALDWLNDNSTEDVSFYGVTVELWQIDDSKPAVRFNVVSYPSEPIRQTAIARAAEDLTDTKKLQLEFWTQFREAMKATGQLTSLRAARPQYWYDLPLGRANIHLSLMANTFENKVGVRVYLRGQVADTALAQLEPQRDVLEKEIGARLEWNPHPDKQDKIIALRMSADLHAKDKWNDYIQWLVNTTLKFRKAFAERVKALDLSNENEEDRKLAGS